MTSAEPPERGEIWLTTLGAGRPGEPGKTRPAVVLTPAALSAGSRVEQVVVVPLSASVAASPLRPPVSTRSGIARSSCAVPRAVRGVNPSRMVERVGRASDREMAAIGSALAIVLGLAEH